MTIAAFFASIWQTFESLLARPSAPIATVVTAGKPDVVATVAAYLESKSIAITLVRTGGVIHKISTGTAQSDAAAIVKHAKARGLKISLVTSFVEQESAGDPVAINPNKQVAKPNESAGQAFAHADLGIAQLDGATLEGMPEFKGATPEQIEAKAFDADWALDVMCQIIAANQRFIASATMADPTLLHAIPNGDVRIAQANCYNRGAQGTLGELRSAAPNLTYGEQVIARADALAPILDV